MVLDGLGCVQFGPEMAEMNDLDCLLLCALHLFAYLIYKLKRFENSNQINV